MGWVRAVIVFIGLMMLIVGVSATDETPLWMIAALAFPGLALMFVFGVMFEDERDY
jgi:peptidoglycan/LPS O-acetylase OafA/YrhL